MGVTGPGFNSIYKCICIFNNWRPMNIYVYVIHNKIRRGITLLWAAPKEYTHKFYTRKIINRWHPAIWLTDNLNDRQVHLPQSQFMEMSVIFEGDVASIASDNYFAFLLYRQYIHLSLKNHQEVQQSILNQRKTIFFSFSKSIFNKFNTIYHQNKHLYI